MSDDSSAIDALDAGTVDLRWGVTGREGKWSHRVTLRTLVKWAAWRHPIPYLRWVNKPIGVVRRGDRGRDIYLVCVIGGCAHAVPLHTVARDAIGATDWICESATAHEIPPAPEWVS